MRESLERAYARTGGYNSLLPQPSTSHARPAASTPLLAQQNNPVGIKRVVINHSAAAPPSKRSSLSDPRLTSLLRPSYIVDSGRNEGYPGGSSNTHSAHPSRQVPETFNTRSSYSSLQPSESFSNHGAHSSRSTGLLSAHPRRQVNGYQGYESNRTNSRWQP